MPQAIHISPIDNVVVALHPIAKGTLVEVDGLAVTALEDIPQGHKMAVKPIKNGENVIKYGFPIGHATADAAPGTWMHTHNVHTNLSGEVEYSYNPAPDLAPLPKVEPETFMGFRRKDGRAAIRNEIWIIPTVGCVNDIAKKIVANRPESVDDTFYGDWIRGYASDGYAAGNVILIETLDRLSAHYTEEQLRHLEDIFIACSRYEMVFWQMAWEMRQ